MSRRGCGKDGRGQGEGRAELRMKFKMLVRRREEGAWGIERAEAEDTELICLFHT